MTPEAQRIAIAEACGWRNIDGGALTIEPNDSVQLPNYLSDLDAIHEAEKILTMGQHFEFRQHLWNTAVRFITKPDSQGRSVRRHYASATAAQRAEAFLRTLNLWDDTK